MSGSLRAIVYVDCSGPLFNGKAEEEVTRFLEDARQKIAGRGVRLLGDFPMDKTGRATGAFREHLKAVNRGSAIAIPAPMIRGVVWGPWLQGSTKRNRSTRFRGYRLFTKVQVQLDQEATGIAERELEKFLPQMGGD